VPPGLLPQWILEKWPEEHLTSIDAILQAFDTYLENDKLCGRVLEVSGEEQFFRKPVDFSNETMRWTYEDAIRVKQS
jgi:15-hydroxyprostaglandin dehydrogenase (NAD)